MKDIENFEGLYAITEDGQVWSYKSKKFIKPFKNNKGYLQIPLYKGGKEKKYLLHRLVAQAYICNPENLETVDHIDGNKENNFIENLQWMTREDNVKKARNKKVYCIELDKVFESQTAAAEYFNGSNKTISACLCGRIKTAFGYHWQYVD